MQRMIESVDPDMATVLRTKSPAQRLEIFAGMWRSARDMLRRLLRAEHPEWTDAELERAVAQRLSHGAD